MITLYYVQDKNTKYTHPESDLLFQDKSKLEEVMKKLSNGFMTMFENDRYEIKNIEVSDKCKCDDYMQSTMFLFKNNDENNIEIVGSDNYIGIHKKINIPFTVDIEQQTNGNYQLMSEDYFKTHYQITKKDTVTLFEEDHKKIEDAVNLHPMGSYQIGEIARLSTTLYDRGIDVIKQLESLHLQFGINND